MKTRNSSNIKFAAMAFGLMIGLCQPEVFAGGVGFVPTMNELRSLTGTPGQMVRLGGYHRVGDLGGGEFVWQADSTKADNGGTVIAAGSDQGRWERVFDGIVHVTHFGATGDGVTDDTTAIQAAINSVSSTASPGVIMEKDRKVGGTVFFPAGKYVITDTLLVGPSTMLTGTTESRGFQRREVVANEFGSVIVARFDDPLKWMISSAVYIRKGEGAGDLLGYRQLVSGKGYDFGEVSRANGITIRNLLLIGRDGQQGEIPYGGIRLQCSPGALVEGVGIYQVSVGVMFNSGWGLAMRNSAIQSYLYGVLALYSVNGLQIDNCYINCYGKAATEITELTVAPGGREARGAASHLPEGLDLKRTGIFSQYAYLTLNNVITEHWEIARFHLLGRVVDTMSWLEANSDWNYVFARTDFLLNNPHSYAPGMVDRGQFMLVGERVNGVINQSGFFPIVHSPEVVETSRILVNTPAPKAKEMFDLVDIVETR